MVEGETKGNLDLITIDGDNAKIETIKGGFDGPVSLVQVGDQIYVLDVPLRYLLGQEAKDKKAPPPFRRSRSKRRSNSVRTHPGAVRLGWHRGPSSIKRNESARFHGCLKAAPDPKFAEGVIQLESVCTSVLGSRVRIKFSLRCCEGFRLADAGPV